MHRSVQCKNAQKLQRAITQEVLLIIYSKVNQVIYSSLLIYYSNFKALALKILRYFADKISSIFFQRAITQEMGIILIIKKYMSAIFHEESQV